MQIWIIRAFFMILSAAFGYGIDGIYGGAVALIVAIIAIALESSVPRPLLRDFFACFVGLTFGLIFAGIVIYIMSQTTVVTPMVRMGTILVMSYAGMVIIYRRRKNFGFFSRSSQGGSSSSPSYKILDTSVIIDGRILEICQTGFLTGIIVIPRFVLNELQHIADSTEQLRRNKGRRGFKILRDLQNDPDMEVDITEEDFPDIAEVDAKLVRLAQELDAKIVTNDFNLSKVAELQGVTVLNINALANAVRPVVVAGEVIQVHVLKEGKELNQGVGYLDDGTMVIVEGGKSHVGQIIDVVVTQMLRTSAGQMIFTRRKADEVDANESEDMRSYPRGW